MQSEAFGKRAVPGHHSKDSFFRYLLGPKATDKGSMGVTGAQHLTGSNPTSGLLHRGVSLNQTLV